MFKNSKFFKKQFFSYIIIILNFSFLNLKSNNLKLLDKIDCIVFGDLDNYPITWSDLYFKKDLAGDLTSKDSILKQILINEALEIEKLSTDSEAATEKYFNQIKSQNKLTETDLKDLFAQLGRTYLEGKELLANNYSKELFQHTLKDKSFVTNEQIKNYALENPEFNAPIFYLEIAIINYNSENKSELEMQLKNYKTTGIKPGFVNFSEKLQILESELPEVKKNSLEKIMASQIVIFDNEAQNFFECYKLIEKTQSNLKSLEERYIDINKKLNLKFYNEKLEAFYAEKLPLLKIFYC